MKFSIRPALHKQAQEKSILSELIDEFQIFKKGEQSPRFGIDVPYHNPRPYAEWAKLMHTHILLKDAHAIASDRTPIPSLGNISYIEWAIKQAEKFRDQF